MLLTNRSRVRAFRGKGPNTEVNYVGCQMSEILLLAAADETDQRLLFLSTLYVVAKKQRQLLHHARPLVQFKLRGNEIHVLCAWVQFFAYPTMPCSVHEMR